MTDRHPTPPGAPAGSTITLTSSLVTLVGVLSRPAGNAAVPAVLIINGSGPPDRDGNQKRLRLDVSRQIADALREAGIASLRYDKRGVGASQGDFYAAGLHDNVTDATAALHALRGQPGIDPERVFARSQRGCPSGNRRLGRWGARCRSSAAGADRAPWRRRPALAGRTGCRRPAEAGAGVGAAVAGQRVREDFA
jgi:fermentation-respiration switch protein FrsA (DUF1100 family)